jgi:hypothetical protein
LSVSPRHGRKRVADILPKDKGIYGYCSQASKAYDGCG